MIDAILGKITALSAEIHTSQTEALWLLPLAIPICIWVSWSDLKFMLIPNKAVIALLIVFLIMGLFAFSPYFYAWRWSHFVIVLVLGIVINAAGLAGAGDAKYAAAMAPFIARADLLLIILLFAAILPAAYVTHRIFRSIPAVKKTAGDWKSWGEVRKFPMGFALAGTLLAYLGLAIY
ncbi:MAG: prepilin peptidase [Paracoccaceae bacterium]|nr:prepilin peptidase [Paracoccaceae bacterium]